MNWPDERYVRVYTRDTGDWLLLSFEAQAVWQLMLRKFDRSGTIYVGRGGRGMLAAVLGHHAKQALVDAALTELLADGCCTISADGGRIIAPNFSDAQDWVATPAERMKKHRAKKRAGGQGAKSAETVEPTVTNGDAALREVTPVTNVTQPLPRAVPPVPCLPSVPPLPPVPAKDAAPPPAVELLIPDIQRPTTEPEIWTGDEFWAWAQDRRRAGGLLVERQRPRDLQRWYSAALMSLNGNVKALQEAFYAFGEDAHWQQAQPPLPFQAFISQWDRFVGAEVKRVAAR